MAQPIIFHAPAKAAMPEAEHLRSAPAEHADAILSAYGLLQLLHDRGVLNLLRGLVGKGDELIGAVAGALDTPESIRAIRNFVLLTKFFANMPPEVLGSLTCAVDAEVKMKRSHKPPGMWSLLWRLRSQDSRRAVAAGLDLVERLGKAM